MPGRGTEKGQGCYRVIPEGNEKLFKDFCIFSQKQLDSWDIDPMYPVLLELYKAKGLDENKALWWTFLYVAWYHIGSAERSWAIWPEPTRISLSDIPEAQQKSFSTGTERRLFRGRFKDFITHVNSFMSITNGDIVGWLNASIGRGGEEGWSSLRSEFEVVKFNGPWASYKWADLMKHVHSCQITANDIGVGGGSATAGPVPGMVKLTGRAWQECARDISLQKALLHISKQAGVAFDGLDQLETALCDFNSLHKGKYYSGHDIDHQMDQLSHSSASLWEARSRAIPSQYRGEVHGWFGVRKERNKVYKTHGVVI